jgi:hypothetical protein
VGRSASAGKRQGSGSGSVRIRTIAAGMALVSRKEQTAGTPRLNEEGRPLVQGDQ